MNHKNLRSVIKTNPVTHEVDPPSILLKRERGNSVAGKIRYFNLVINLSGIAQDEISFKVYKYTDGEKSHLWDSIRSDKVIDVAGYGQFEIDITKETDEGDNIVKTVHGVSLECELGATNLYEFHCNDDYYFEYMADSDSDSFGNIIPIKLWNPSDQTHSLLHLILEKCPAWHFARVPAYITIVQNGKHVKEAVYNFQRTFTFDNKSIYDVLVNDIATESNLVFAFDTENREIFAYDKFEEIGEDTSVFINTRNLAEKISIRDNKDALINTLRVSGGDDIINNYIAAINVTGTNYITMYSDYMYEDMPDGLTNAIKSYQTYKSSLSEEYYGGYDVFNLLTESGNGIDVILKYKGITAVFSSLPPASPNNTGNYYYVTADKKYYVSNGTSWVVCGAFTRLCSAYDYLGYLEHSMMPNVSLKNTSASAQINILASDLRYNKVSIQNMSIYNPSSFTGITNSVTAYCKVILDNRYTLELVNDPVNNYPGYASGLWTGKIRVYRTTDKTDSAESVINVSIDTDAINFVKQKILKALAKDSMTEVENDILAYKTSADYNKLVTYFQKYCLERLKSFHDAYENCLSILMSMKSSHSSGAVDELYSMYVLRRDAVFQVLRERQAQIESQKDFISRIEDEKEQIQKKADFKTYLDKTDTSYWRMLNSYRREADYTNDNYISEGLETDGQILAKCKELLDNAEYELSMACQLQRTLSIDLENLLVMPEFETFWDKFCLYNYIRVESDQEIMKLRLVGVDIDFDSIEKLNVTFSENISGNGNIHGNDITDIFQNISSIAPSYNFTKLQASQGKKGYNQVADWIDKGLLAASTTISNSDNNEVTFNNYGINLKDMTEEGNYGDWQIRLIGQGIYFTNDNWRTCYGALGSIYIDGVRTTGLIAENLIGRLIAGTQLYITNEHGSFLLDKDCAKFYNIVIDYSDENGNNIKLGGATNHLISISHNGKENFYFDNDLKRMVLYGDIYAENGSFKGTIEAGTSVISPVITGGSISGSTINIGNGKFTVNEHGNLYAETGEFKGTVRSGSMIGGSIHGSTIDIGGNFYVDGNGFLTAKKGTFAGELIAAKGTFSGELYGGSININNRFKVDTMGNLTIGNPASNDIFRVSKDGNVTLPSSARISWNQVTDTGNVLQQNDNNSRSYITTITKDTVTTAYVNALRITAKNIDADTIISNKISVTEGTIGGFTIGDRSLFNGKSSLYSASNGVYLGTDGISCGNNFSVTNSGILKSNWGIFENASFKNGIYLSYNGSQYPVVTLSSPGELFFANKSTHTYFPGTVSFSPSNNEISFLIDTSGASNFYKRVEFDNTANFNMNAVFKNDMVIEELVLTGSNGDPLWIGDRGHLHRGAGSLKKWKHSISEIKDNSIDPHKLYDIPLYQFIYNYDYLSPEDSRYGEIIPGIMVDDLINIYPIAVNYRNGEPANWNERYILVPMLYLIQEQHEKIESQHKQIETNKSEILSLQGEVAILKQKLKRMPKDSSD